MDTDLEEMLTRELREVTEGLRVPPVPDVASTTERRPARHRTWVPLLVAAAVVLVLGVAVLLVDRQGGHDVQPAPAPSPTSSPSTPSATPRTISRSAPAVPYVLDRRLHVAGAVVPGEWWSVQSRGEVWLALRTDGSWWWGGPGVEPARVDAHLEQPPVLSPGGAYIAYVDVSGDRAHLNGFGTQPAGEGFGASRVDFPAVEDGIPVRVRAVTDNADVIVQGTRTSLMWRALYGDQRTVVDLSETAPDQVVLDATAAGLVVVDGSTGAVDATETEPYLASLSADGHLTERATLPTYDDLRISPRGTWLVRSRAGTVGGDVAGVPILDAQPVGEDRNITLHAPGGRVFATGTWAWEDERTLVSVLLPDGGDGTATMGRCDVELGLCRTIASAPGTD